MNQLTPTQAFEDAYRRKMMAIPPSMCSPGFQRPKDGQNEDVTARAMDRIWAHIPDGPFTARDVAIRSGAHARSTGKDLHFLERGGLVEKIGTADVKDGRGARFHMHLWRKVGV